MFHNLKFRGNIFQFRGVIVEDWETLINCLAYIGQKIDAEVNQAA